MEGVSAKPFLASLFWSTNPIKRDMAKADVYSIDGKKTGNLDLPPQFSEKVRKDLIKRAVLAIQSHNYQPYGSDPLAGKRQGYHTSKRRRDYKTTYGNSRSRVRRKHLWHRGTQFGWVAAFVANAVGGRKAYPPTAEKILSKKINKKERRKAIRSAIAACNSIIVEDKIESLNKARDVQKALENLNLNEKLAKAKEKKVRSGKGTLRGRKYKRKKGPLLVVAGECKLINSASNIPGVDITYVKSLNAELLAPGTNPGRITVWSKNSIELMKKEALFA